MQLLLSPGPQVTRILPVLICGLILFWPTQKLAADSGLQAGDTSQSEGAAQQMLLRMWQSGRQTNYQGVFTYQQGSQLDSFRVAHRVENGKEFEYLSRLNGIREDVVRPGNPLHCKRVGESLVEQGADMAHLYRYTPAGEERIAGRRAHKLLLEPKDFMRNGYRLWLDDESGLLLKAEVVSRVNGRLLERFQFVDLNIGDPTEEQGKLAGEQLPVDLLPCDGEQGIVSGRWQIDQLPKGFVLSDVRQWQNGEKLLYSDGMASFSVFVEPADTAMADYHGVRGATVLYVNYMQDVEKRLYSVSVVGEIPMPLAKRLAHSVRAATP